MSTAVQAAAAATDIANDIATDIATIAADACGSRNGQTQPGSKSKCIVEFALGVKEFIRELMHAFPGVMEFKLIFAAYKVVKSFGKKHVYNAWREVVDEDMEVLLCKRDDKVLMSPDFHMPGPYSSLYDGYLPTFRRLWATMTDENKDAVWRHFERLVTLSCKCKACI